VTACGRATRTSGRRATARRPDRRDARPVITRPLVAPDRGLSEQRSRASRAW
jgi:hypothetical protein